MSGWTPADSAELYDVARWGQGYFRVNERGHVAMNPPGDAPLEIDLALLVQDIVERGIELPVLIRMTDLIRARIDAMAQAFSSAMTEYEYTGGYRGVYPIKVNQQRHVVEDVVRFSRAHHLGLEAGSKPELLVALATLDDPSGLVICNGYKDREIIEMAVLAHKIGRRVIVVIEKREEVDLIIELAREHAVEPVVGVRARLSSSGSGKWRASAGDRAKFGLSIQELVAVARRLRKAGLLSTLQLLHFHIGSQVSAISAFKTALREGARIFVELHGLGAPMRYFDVGGGLAVDYDGSRTDFASSMNYDLEEYAMDVIANIAETCDEAGVAHPDIITEAGRSTVAYNSVLVFPVLGTSAAVPAGRMVPPGDDAHDLVRSMFEVWEAITAKNLLSPYHDAVELRGEALTRFNLGLIGIETRAALEDMYWRVIARLVKASRGMKYPPEEIEALPRTLADTYFCNFSVFQSAPDAWAIEQLFPVMPIHRLDTRPTRRAVLADITCDSDGKVDRFIDLRDVKFSLPLHPPGHPPYLLGMFLLGAYQEILGDLHNLFGDTNAVHVIAVPEPPGYHIEHVVQGDSVTDVLGYVQYDRKELEERLGTAVVAAVETGRLTAAEADTLNAIYRRGLQGYTYLGPSTARLQE